MSTCSNCYNGCTEIVSDRCVKYTGIDVPILGIKTGDSLSYVEQALITFLTSTLDGKGIIIDISDIDVCQLVQKYLPTCKDLSIVDISKALIQAACDLQEQVDIIVAELAELNADYTIGCLTGVTPSSNTHAIVQAVINTLCELKTDFDLLLDNLPNTYVSLDDLDTLIQDYLDSQNFLELAKYRMIPYSPIPYFGALSNYPAPGDSFDITGEGSGYWDRIFLCNGDNGTPDLRGRTLVGATTGMGGGTFNSAVNPLLPGNPNYIPGFITGANQISLSINQMPDHTHTATALATVTPNPHKHTIFRASSDVDGTAFSPGTGTLNTGDTSEVSLNVDVNVTVGNKGGGLPHANIQPSMGCYYIMYIP